MAVGNGLQAKGKKNVDSDEDDDDDDDDESVSSDNSFSKPWREWIQMFLDSI